MGDEEKTNNGLRSKEEIIESILKLQNDLSGKFLNRLHK